MDGSFNYMQKLGERLSAKRNPDEGVEHNQQGDLEIERGREEVTEQPAVEDIANALQIIGDPRITRIDPHDSLRVVELLNSALEKMGRPHCMICDRRVAKDRIHDDGVCFDCRNPDVEEGMQSDAARLTPLQRGVLRVLRGYGQSTLTQVLDRVLPVHDRAQEGHVAQALEELMFTKLVVKVGSRRYDITEVGLAELRTR